MNVIVMLIWVLVIVVVSVSCNTQTQSVRTLPTPAPLPDILAGTVEEWELTDVLLRSVRRDGTVESKTVFRVRFHRGGMSGTLRWAVTLGVAS